MFQCHEIVNLHVPACSSVEFFLGCHFVCCQHHQVPCHLAWVLMLLHMLQPTACITGCANTFLCHDNRLSKMLFSLSSYISLSTNLSNYHIFHFFSFQNMTEKTIAVFAVMFVFVLASFITFKLLMYCLYVVSVTLAVFTSLNFSSYLI